MPSCSRLRARVISSVLDAVLGGGNPLGQLAEVSSESSKLSLLFTASWKVQYADILEGRLERWRSFEMASDKKRRWQCL